MIFCPDLIALLPDLLSKQLVELLGVRYQRL